MRPSLALVLALATPTSIPAIAQTTAGQPSAHPLLSRAELRACIQREEELDRRWDALRKAQDAHEASSEKLSAEALELSRLLRALDTSDGPAVDLYNQRNDARNAAVDLHNKQSRALNAALADLQEQEADYMAGCVSRPFLKADESAVLRELGLSERREDREKRRGPTRSTGKSAT